MSSELTSSGPSPFSSGPSPSIVKVTETYKGITNEVKSFLFSRQVLTAGDAKELASLIQKIEMLMKRDKVYSSLYFLQKSLSDIQDVLKSKTGKGTQSVKVQEISAEILSNIRAVKQSEAMAISRIVKGAHSTPPAKSENIYWYHIPWFNTALDHDTASSFINHMPEGTFILCGLSNAEDLHKAIVVRTKAGAELYEIDIDTGNFVIDGSKYKTLEEFINKFPEKFKFPCLNTPYFEATKDPKVAEEILRNSNQPFVLRESSKQDFFEISYIKDGLVKHVPVIFDTYGWSLFNTAGETEENIYPQIEELFNEELADKSDIVLVKSYLKRMPAGTYLLYQSGLQDISQEKAQICVRTTKGIETIPVSTHYDFLEIEGGEYENIEEFAESHADKFKSLTMIPRQFDPDVKSSIGAAKRLKQTQDPYLLRTSEHGDFKLNFLNYDKVASIKVSVDPDMGWCAHLDKDTKTKGYGTLDELFENEFFMLIPIPSQLKMAAQEDSENRDDEMLISKIPSSVWQRYEKWINHGHEDGMEPPKDLIDDFQKALDYDKDDVNRILEILNDIWGARIARLHLDGEGEVDKVD